MQYILADKAAFYICYDAATASPVTTLKYSGSQYTYYT